MILWETGFGVSAVETRETGRDLAVLLFKSKQKYVVKSGRMRDETGSIVLIDGGM